VVVDHGLVGLAVLGAAKKKAAVWSEVVAHLEHDLEIAEVLVGDDEAAVLGDVLTADDGAVLDAPVAAGLVLACAAVAALGRDVPAFERLAVEKGDVTVVAFLILAGRRLVPRETPSMAALPPTPRS
jgi:hypothetical protein